MKERLSLDNPTIFGFDLSVQLNTRIRSGLSVFNSSYVFDSIGSLGLSILSGVRCGSTFSTVEAICGRGPLLVLAWPAAGSRCLSVSHEASFASAASVRALCKLGSGLTVFGHNRVAVFASVGGSCDSGSSLSVQSFVRIGSSMNAAYDIVSGGRCGVAGATQQVSVMSYLSSRLHLV